MPNAARRPKGVPAEGVSRRDRRHGRCQPTLHIVSHRLGRSPVTPAGCRPRHIQTGPDLQRCEGCASLLPIRQRQPQPQQAERPGEAAPHPAHDLWP